MKKLFFLSILIFGKICFASSIEKTITPLAINSQNLGGKTSSYFDDKITALESNEVIVKSTADLPSPIANQYPLETNKTYKLNSPLINLGNIGIKYPDSGNTDIQPVADALLLYTGTSTMFTANVTTAGSFFGLRNGIRISCPSGTLFDIQGNSNNTFFVDTCIFSNVSKAGTIKNCNLSFLGSGLFDFGEGLSLLNMERFSVSRNVFADWKNQYTTVMLYVSSAASPSIKDNAINTDSYEYFLHIESGTYGGGTFLNNRINGTQQFFSTTSLRQDDIRFIFANNYPLADSTAVGVMNVSTNVASVQTPIAAANTPVKSSATWVFKEHERFIFSDGRLTYIGKETIKVKVTVNSTLLGTLGDAHTLAGYIAKNGNVSDGEDYYGTNQGSSNSSNPTAVSLSGLFEISTNDYLEFWVANKDTSNNLIVTAAQFIVAKN